MGHSISTAELDKSCGDEERARIFSPDPLPHCSIPGKNGVMKCGCLSMVPYAVRPGGCTRWNEQSGIDMIDLPISYFQLTPVIYFTNFRR